ncbi:MAG: ABC transporter ATP-binding protein [Chitinophagaceae bacterium]|nr:ABC transporter ATP-binding protein [Chitinophagaceae bacterium]
MDFLQVKDLYKRNGSRIAVDHVSFSMHAQQATAIAGETGSGKTSLLKMIGGLMQPDSGEVLFEGKRVEGPLERLIPGHENIAYLSQHFELRNNYWVYELLEMVSKLPEAEAAQICSVCQIEHLLQRRTNELSGGEKQRIVLAMQLVKKPKLLLLDEPFSNLDAIHEQTIKDVIHDVSEQFQTSCIMVSHDGKDVLSWAGTIYIMQNGAIIQSGTPHQIYYKPLNEYCAGLFGEYNLLPVNFFTATARAKQKKIIIRPEQLRITTSKTNAVKATVTSVLFFGSYYMIEATAGKHGLKIKTTSNNVSKGDAVLVTSSVL